MALTRTITPNTGMTEHIPSPYLCRVHKLPVHYYGDGAIWCDECGGAKQSDEVVDIRRGRPVPPPPAPEWKEIPK